VPAHPHTDFTRATLVPRDGAIETLEELHRRQASSAA
jgi:hypothetical protein